MAENSGNAGKIATTTSRVKRERTAPFATDSTEFIQSVDINYVVSPIERELLVSV